MAAEIRPMAWAPWGVVGPVEESDEALLDRFGDGDLEALRRFYDRMQAAAYALAYRVLGDRDSAEDVLQEAFLAAWRRADTFRPDRGSARTWFLGIVRNRAIDVLRARAGRPLTVELDPSFGPTGDVWREVSQRIDAAVVRRALADLPAEQRQTIELAYFGGLTCVEIAGRMAVPVGTVKGRLRLALKKLRASLAGLAVVA